MSKMTPLQELTRQHGSKTELIDKLVGKLETFEDEDEDAFRARLNKISNKKLLRLHAATTRVDSEFGSKANLIDALIKLSRPSQINDGHYKAKLQQYQITRLLDMHDSERRGGARS